MNRELYRLLFDAAPQLTIGEAVQRAKQATTDMDVARPGYFRRDSVQIADGALPMLLM